MQLEYGNMWDAYDQADAWFFTGNGVLNGRGELVMGAGIAKQVKKRYPGLPLQFGKHLQDTTHQYNTQTYRYYLIPPIDNTKIGILQSKLYWRDPSPSDLVRESISRLCFWANSHRYKEIHVNMPGIGYGGLKPKDVLPSLKRLPNHVHVWQYKRRT